MFQIKSIVNNTAAHKIKAFKRFMRYAQERGWHSTNDFTNFTIKGYEPETFALNNEQLRAIEALNLEGQSSLLVYARDFFLIECYTGMRFSDIMKLTRENLKPDSVWYRIEKTEQPHRVPLFDESYNLLAKYLLTQGKMPFKENAELNKYIKKVCKMAGLTQPHSISRTQGNQRITINKPLHDFISTHSARRTCITYLHSKGISVEEITVITRQTPEIVRLYVKLSETETHDKFRAVMTERLNPHKNSSLG